MAEIRPLTRDDITALLSLEEACFSDPWNERQFEGEFDNQLAHYEGAFVNGCLVGYAGFWQVLDEGHIMRIAVKEALRKQGIGSALMDTLLQEGAGLGILYWTLEVRESNAAAIRLYEKSGFHGQGVRPGYYENPEEGALIMWRGLEEKNG